MRWVKDNSRLVKLKENVCLIHSNASINCKVFVNIPVVTMECLERICPKINNDYDMAMLVTYFNSPDTKQF